MTGDLFHGDSPHGNPFPPQGDFAALGHFAGLRQRCGITAVTLRQRWCGIIYPSYGGGSVAALPHSAGVGAGVSLGGECSPSPRQPRVVDAMGPSGGSAMRVTRSRDFSLREKNSDLEKPVRCWSQVGRTRER